MSTPPATRPATGTPAARLAIGTLAVELRHAILRVSRRVRQERSTDDVTPGQLACLSALEVNGPMTPRELATREKVQPPSMTRTLAGLEGLGLVSRTDHPTDGRQVLVALTEQGCAVVRDTRRRRDAWLARQIASLDPSERAALAQAAVILDRMARS